MVLLADVEVNGRIFWCFNPRTQKIFPMACSPGWSLVNPMLYNKIALLRGEPNICPRTQFTFLEGDKAYMYTTGLYFCTADPNNKSLFGEEFPDSFFYGYLANLRYASKQFGIAKEWSQASSAAYELKELPDFSFPLPGQDCATNGYTLDTSITDDDLYLAHGMSLQTNPPAYDVALQDGILALHEQDCTTAILYAAVAMESLARKVLKDKYEESFAAVKSVGVLSISIGGDTEDEQKRKDILWKLLFDNCHFEDLLHHLPTLLMNRSLHHDDKDLYDNAITVYKTRNTIMHRGRAGETNDRWAQLGQAIRAIKTAIRLVEWFGERGGYSIAFDGNRRTSIYTAIEQQ